MRHNQEIHFSLSVYLFAALSESSHELKLSKTQL